RPEMPELAQRHGDGTLRVLHGHARAWLDRNEQRVGLVDRELVVEQTIGDDGELLLPRRLEDVRRGLIDADDANRSTAELDQLVERLDVPEELLRDVGFQHDHGGAGRNFRLREPASLRELTAVDLGVPVVGAGDDPESRARATLLELVEDLSPEAGIPDLRKGRDALGLRVREIRPDAHPLREVLRIERGL